MPEALPNNSPTPVGDNASHSHFLTPQKKPPGIRWWPPVAVLLLAAIGLMGVAASYADDRTMRLMLTSFIVIAIPILLTVWWVLFSRLQWKTRLKGAAVLCTVAVVFVAVVRIDGFQGDMIPVWSFRWEPIATQRAREYWNSQHRDNTTVAELENVEPLVVRPGDWPEFRGLGRTGTLTHASIRTNWASEPPELIWKHPVGLGWSSFAVVDGLAFTQEQRDASEAVVCYDFATGDQVWVHTDREKFIETMGGIGPRATPTVYDSRVYALGATGILNCLDARTGRAIWTRNILEGRENLEWAMAGSPLVYEDVVVVNCGPMENGSGGAVSAFDRASGATVWASGMDQAGYSSPTLATLDGVEQILVFDGEGLKGHDKQTGDELWSFSWYPTINRINATQPLVLDDHHVFLSTGYGVGSVLLQVGRDGGEWQQPVKLGETRDMKLKFNNAVVHNGYVYGIDDGILACLDLSTLERKWKRGRYGYGQVLLLDDLLLILAESGEVVLVRTNPQQFEELANFQAIEGKTWNEPVLVRGQLLVRNDHEAACYNIAASEEPRVEAVAAVGE